MQSCTCIIHTVKANIRVKVVNEMEQSGMLVMQHKSNTEKQLKTLRWLSVHLNVSVLYSVTIMSH